MPDNNDSALLLSEDIIAQRQYHHSEAGITWEECGLRQYLNGEFLRQFSGQDQAHIMQVKNENSDNQRFGTGGGNTTIDKVFLLSIEEVIKHFGDSGQLQKRPEKNFWCIDDQFNSRRQANYNDEVWFWLLRSPGGNGVKAASVDDDGRISFTGESIVNDRVGLRPAIWVRLQNYTLDTEFSDIDRERNQAAQGKNSLVVSTKDEQSKVISDH